MLKRLWFSGSTWATAEAMCFLHSVGHSGDHPMVLEDMKNNVYNVLTTLALSDSFIPI